MPKQQPIEIFMPPNMLKAKMGGTFIGLDIAAMKRAEAAMEDLKVEFANWMNADVERLAACRNAYDANSTDDAKGDLYRASHDLKGQARTFEFPFAARIASSLCKMLDTPAITVPLKLVDAHVDAIRIVVARNMKDANDPISLALASELEQQVSELVATA